MLVVLSEASFFPPTSLNARELSTITEAARLYGCRIYPLPPDVEAPEDVADAFAYIPQRDEPVPAVWVGFIPSVARYAAVFEAAQQRSISLLNTPDQYQTAMEFDRFYAPLGDLTPESRVIRHADECASIAKEMGYPVFVKGSIKSNKDQGWPACVANDEAELRERVQQLLARPGRARGRVIVRRIAPLRHAGSSPDGFPLGREYRVFLYRQQVLAFGYYWDEYADPFPLQEADRRALLNVSIEATRRVGVPFIAVDVGQVDMGEWIVIEVGDAQFSGLSHVPVLELWSKLVAATARPEAH